MKLPRVSPQAFQLERELLRTKLLPCGSRILVGVSGGPDSVALLSLLSELQPRMRYSLRAVYINHGWRPSAARREEIFVQKLCRRFRIPIQVVRLKGAKRPRHSWEGTARQARYDALERIARRSRFQFIALAHTLEDQAETVLLALFRGSGMQGAAGMAPARPLHRGISVVRPLLKRTHAELKDYLRGHGISWIIDISNKDERLRRNWVRRRLLPKISAEFGPHVPAQIVHFSELVREEQEWLEGVVHAWCRRWVRCGPSACSVSIALLQRQPLAFRRRVVRWMVQNVYGSLTGIGSAHIEAVLSLPAAGRGTVSLPKRFSAQLVRKRLKISLSRRRLTLH